MIVAAAPFNIPAPTEAMHAAPMSAMDAFRAGSDQLPLLMRSAMVSAANRPWTPAGIPVLGGAGDTGLPVGVVFGFEIACGGANAIPTAKTFE